MAKVTTLSGTTSASIYLNNSSYNNGAGNVSTFNMPLGVAVDANGNVYAFDDYVNVIRKIQPDGFTTKFCGDATFASPSWSFGFADGANPLFTNITAIATDKQNNIYVADFNRLRKITQQGVASTLIINQTDLKDAQGLVVDNAGNIYVANTGRKNVLKVTPDGNVTILATGFTYPKGITIDNLGNLFVTDINTVKKVTPSGKVTVFASGFSNASGIGVLNGSLLVSDSQENKIKIVTAPGVVSDYAGSGISGFRDSSDLFFWHVPKFYNPQGLVVGNNGVCYVADTWNQRIRKVV